MPDFPSRPDDRQLTAVDYLAVIWRHKWTIAALVAVALAVAMVVTVRQPRIYEASTTLLVPREASSGLLAGVAALGGGQGGGQGTVPQFAGLSLGSPTPNRDVVVSVLRSRTVAEAAVDRFKLQERYGRPFRADAAQALQARTAVSVSKEGVITVTVEDTNAIVAADIANFLVEEMDRLMAKFGLVEAGRQRRFVAEQLNLAKDNLVKTEEALRAFQERNRAIVLQDQTRGVIDAVGRLKGEILASEVRLQVMRDFATERDPDIVMQRRRLEELKRQLGQMHSGVAVAPGERGNGVDVSDVALPLARVPRLGIELATLTRNFRIQETLVTLLIQQLEQAKISEAKDGPLVRVLDPAVTPLRHIRPQLRLALAVAGGAALVVGIVLAGVLEYVWASRRARALAS